MKTILIVIAGMADLPDPITRRDTPLNVANIPSLHTLARRGELTSLSPLGSHYISHVNSTLSLLGYDLDRGEPSTRELMEYGLEGGALLTDFPTLRPFIIPGFSGHGVCVTTSAWVRGVAKCALLKPLDIYSPGSSDAEILETMAELAINSIKDNEFVLVYVDSPLKAALKGDFDSKVTALELIDRHLVTPVADFVWKSELLLHLAVTTDLVTPWHKQRPSKLSVPVVFYFNNHDWEGDPDQKLTEEESLYTEGNTYTSSDFMRYLSNFSVSDEEEELPY